MEARRTRTAAEVAGGIYSRAAAAEEEAEGVVRIAKPLHAKVNVIPYNPIREMDFKTPEKKRLEDFCGILEKGGVRVILRQTAGRDIDAACGQLRLDREKLS